MGAARLISCAWETPWNIPGEEADGLIVVSGIVDIIKEGCSGVTTIRGGPMVASTPREEAKGDACDKHLAP